MADTKRCEACTLESPVSNLAEDQLVESYMVELETPGSRAREIEYLEDEIMKGEKTAPERKLALRGCASVIHDGSCDIWDAVWVNRQGRWLFERVKKEIAKELDANLDIEAASFRFREKLRSKE